ncbi:hypothetical protein PACTADRAFT_49303 [Pachysolen tannophilus NRRL Y-2460]|uniref:Glycosyl hydrolase family 76 n=1 Tax=Pachysolen tannophilus NRRL Y-2460 TaxID=669874 RepID=A0A1E4TVU8_PACTA|nr:hypothetical protein PACTADRAFT_49303 [Pachysolen tannophilus NRRL Y-2460]
MPFNTNLEGYNVTRNLWLKFWDGNGKYFRSNEGCNGQINEKFNVWSVSVAVQAIVDGCRIYPKEMLPMLELAMENLFKYRSPQFHGYCAAENFDGNKDIYYDDDAQVASAIITAYEVSGNKKYLDAGRDLVRFLMGGYVDDPNAGCGGGMLWHMERDYVNACTTAECAKAALQLAKFIPEEQKDYVDYARKCIQWQLDHLQDKDDKLIYDGVGKDGQGVNTTKWSYNAGTTLSALSLLYSFEQKDEWFRAASDLAVSICSPGYTLYDRDYPNDEKRFWRDPSYFIQLVIEGLADYMLYFGDKADKGAVERINREVPKHLVYFNKYCLDKSDGLYWQSFEIFTINEEVYKRYKEEFGGHKGYSANREERGHDDKCVKSLIGSGAAARIFYQGARIAPQL